MQIWLGLAILLVAAALNNVVAPGAYLLTCLAATALLVLLANQDGITRAEMGLGPGSLRAGTAWGAALMGIVLAVYLVVLAVPAMRTALVDDRTAQLSAAGLFWQAMVRVPLGTVLLEEMADPVRRRRDGRHRDRRGGPLRTAAPLGQPADGGRAPLGAQRGRIRLLLGVRATVGGMNVEG